MPCRNPCGLYIHLAFTYSDGPWSVLWSKLGLAPPFPPMIMLEVQWSQARCLVCEVVLRVGLQWGPRPKKLQKGVIPFIGQEQAFGPMQFILRSRSQTLENWSVVNVTSSFAKYRWYFFYFQKPILILKSQSKFHQGWFNAKFLDLTLSGFYYFGWAGMGGKY